MIVIGCLCFLIIGGGSTRYRNRNTPMGLEIKEGIIIIMFYLLMPIVGFFLIKFGLKLIDTSK